MLSIGSEITKKKSLLVSSYYLRKFIKEHALLLYFARKMFDNLHSIVFITKIIKKMLFKLIDKKLDDRNLMINVGGGEYVRRHWKVLDRRTKWYNYNKIFIDYCFDLATDKPLPFSNDSVTFFYSSHTLEHIPQEFCQHILDDIYRCLRKGGAVRITVPDFDLAYRAFGKYDAAFFSKFGVSKLNCPSKNIEGKFLQTFATYLRNKVSQKELRKNYNSMEKEKFADFYTQQIPRDFHKRFIGYHINWWNYEKLKRMLVRAGFKKIYLSTAQGSHFSEMRGTGRESGFDSTYPEISLFVEAIKL